MAHGDISVDDAPVGRGGYAHGRCPGRAVGVRRCTAGLSGHDDAQRPTQAVVDDTHTNLAHGKEYLRVPGWWV
jgi:hypothetical protein